jgi:acyl-CoA synthetase (AMP-forming)/AMP-acid ligase II
VGWNFGDILDAISPVLAPETPAFIHGERIIGWGEATRITNNLARGLIARGAKPGDKVAIYMRNRPEYLLALAAAFKARLTHVNVNYRYTPQEVWYIFDNSDAQTVVYASEFRDAVAEIRPRLPKVATWIEVSGDGEVAPFAEQFATVSDDGNGGPLDIVRSGDDQFFIYTGGTTGMPKGVIWTQHDLREITLMGARRLGPVPESPAELAAHIARTGPGHRTLPAPPLMHGTGLLTAMGAMLAGGSVVTLTGESFDADELLAAIDRWRPTSMAIVGDSFARPILNALNAASGRYDVSSIAAIVSSGVMWSLEVKRGLLEHMPTAMLNDGFSSSEALGLGSSVMTKGAEVQTARFRVIGGVRYSIPGDWVTVEPDGALTLLGRGSACINTAGEKVFPEEVEEQLKTHPSVDDALVVGLPDEKWGQAVTGVVELADGCELDEPALRAHVRRLLAGYKTPKRILVTDRPLRAANGKADYPGARAAAEAALADERPAEAAAS